MHNRQSGAAHVNVFFFLVMLVLFLGAIGFAYVTLEDNKRLEAESATATDAVADLKKELLGYKHYSEDVSKPLGLTGDYKGRGDFQEAYDLEKLPKSVTLEGNVTNEIENLAGQIKVPTGVNLTAFFGHIKSSFDGLNSQIATLESERVQLQSQIAALQSELSAEKSTRQSELSTANQLLTTTRDDLQSTIDSQATGIKTVNDEISQIRDSLTTKTEEYHVHVAKVEKQKELLTARNAAMMGKIRLINAPNQPDGMVLSASQAAGLAWINLGRRDMLPVGTKFNISGPGKPGTKATCVVTRIDNDRAEVKITSLADQYNPVVKGDSVRNDLYSPNVRRTIYLMGRFSYPYSRPMVTRLLENLGNIVVDKIGPSVDLVVVGGDVINEEGSGFSPITESDEYKSVLFYGIEIASLHKVREFLKLAD